MKSRPRKYLASCMPASYSHPPLGEKAGHGKAAPPYHSHKLARVHPLERDQYLSDTDNIGLSLGSPHTSRDFSWYLLCSVYSLNCTGLSPLGWRGNQPLGCSVLQCPSLRSSLTLLLSLNHSSKPASRGRSPPTLRSHQGTTFVPEQTCFPPGG
jgi:hypothetical protein